MNTPSQFDKSAPFRLFCEGLSIFKSGGLRLTRPGHRFLLFIATFLPSILLLTIVIFQPWVEPKWLFFDSLAAAELSDDCCHIYYGFVSNLGIFLWIGTAAIALFSAIILWARTKPNPHFLFLLLAGLLSGLLALDDAFLLHEVAFPELGVPQNIVLFIYLILAIAYGLASWRTLLSSEIWLLAIASIFLAVSLMVDQVFHSIDDMIVIIEDSAKFLGLSAWFSFHVLTIGLVLVQNDPPSTKTETAIS